MLIWGAQSQALILTEMARVAGIPVDCYFDPTGSQPRVDQLANLINDYDALERELKSLGSFTVAIGGEMGLVRHRVMQWLQTKGLEPVSLISGDALIASTVKRGLMAQVMPGVILHHFAQYGDACIFNSGCTVDHECRIGHGVHVMGGAAIAGRVTVEDYACIGTNATILPDLTIGRGAYVGAGAVVIKNVQPFDIVVGSPAKVLKQRTLVEPDLPS